MPLDATIKAYPLTWPAGRRRTPQHERKSALFKNGRNPISLTIAIARLHAQISGFTRPGKAWVIDPATVILSSNVPVRKDGAPFGNAGEPADGGVAVYFELKGSPICLWCDRWDRVADNVAAIAAHLEAMRGQERWGVGDIVAAFAGFKALPAPTGPSSRFSTVDTAALWLAAKAGVSVAGVMGNVETYRSGYLVLAREFHPDVAGANDDWLMLQDAKALLDRHHGRAS